MVGTVEVISVELFKDQALNTVLKKRIICTAIITEMFKKLNFSFKCSWNDYYHYNELICTLSMCLCNDYSASTDCLATTE